MKRSIMQFIRIRLLLLFLLDPNILLRTLFSKILNILCLALATKFHVRVKQYASNDV